MRVLFVAVCIVFAVGMLCGFASAEECCKVGAWRIELSGGPGSTLGGNDRSGDFFIKGVVEYEIPTTPHLALGLRLLPFFVYEQNERHEDTVWGAGAGVGGRLYSVKNEYRGLFAEVNVHALGHKNQIADNDSNINFLTGAGVGYKFQGGWHSVLKWEHISNANLSGKNTGADVITLGIGYTF